MILKSDVQDCIFCKSLSWVLVLCRNLGKRHYVFDSFFLSEYRFQIKLDLLCHLWPATGPLPNRRFLSHQSLEWRQEKTRCPKAGRSVVTSRDMGLRAQGRGSSRSALPGKQATRLMSLVRVHPPLSEGSGMCVHEEFGTHSPVSQPAAASSPLLCFTLKYKNCRKRHLASTGTP